MNNARFAALLLCGSCFLFGCGDVADDVADDGGICPPVQQNLLESGTFELTEGPYRSPSEQFPASLAEDLIVEVDRGASRVTVSYTRDGKKIVETYKISASEIEY